MKEELSSFDNQGNEEDRIKLQMVQEQLNIGKEVVEKGTVRISKKVYEVEELINEPVKTEEVHVEKVAVNRIVDSYPEVRYEGDTMIVPVVKEVLVTEKKLMLVEEIFIKKNIVITQEQQVVPLRRESIVVERSTNETKLD